MSYKSIVSLSSEKFDPFSLRSLQDFLAPIHAKNRNSGFAVCAYTHGYGTTLPTNSYVGGCYSPTQNRIYLSPYAKATTTTWHYIDCNTGAVVAYTAPALAGAQHSMVYDPVNDLIYLVPNIGSTTWAYIKCRTAEVVTFSSGSASSVNFAGGVYSPKQKKIYFAPFSGSNLSTWYGIDCTTQAVFSYSNNSGVVPLDNGYAGGYYSPLQDRVYFSASNNYTSPQWHYIDCSSGNVVAYPHGQTPIGTSIGYIYSPTQNRAYLAPYAQSSSSTWYYQDGTTGAVVPYSGASGVPANAYYGGAYSPATNRIYLCPRFSGGTQSSVWHYIDCTTGAVVPYTHGATTVANTYLGMVYSPTQSRIYMIPFAQAAQPQWHYIQEHVSPEIPPAVAAYPLFNKF